MKSTKACTFIATILTLCVLLATSLSAYTSQTARSALQSAAKYVRDAVPHPSIGSVGGEWTILGLARCGQDIPQKYFDDYYERVLKTVKACNGVLSSVKYTEYSRVAIALTSIGKNPADIGGYNLLAPLGDFDKTVSQGLSGPVWALLALDSGNYEIPFNPTAKTRATRRLYIDEILSRQLSNGGFSLTSHGDSPADPDITGMVLQALAPYRGEAGVKSAIDKALSCLSSMQEGNGGFPGMSKSSESSAQVLIALCTLGIGDDDARFVKNGNTVTDNILSFRTSNGGFKHLGSDSTNQMATEQCLCALAALRRFSDGQNSLYDMSDTAPSVSTKPGASVGLPGKHPDVAKTSVVTPGATFSDISAHKSRKAIEACAARGIISGLGNGKFSPNGAVTRAEFAAIIVNGLGLSPKSSAEFIDVPPNAWYAGFVGTASSYGIISGKSTRRFDPEGKVTRQEAAVMLANAAKLAGMDTAMSAAEIRDLLAQFGDYVSSAKWARASLAFCYRDGIFSQDDFDILPSKPILRAEIAEALFRMLGAAKLL